MIWRGSRASDRNTRELLDSIGVDSVKELRHRNPENLKEMIETRHGPVIGLSLAECQDWVNQAKALDV
jgi:hypothetical protein